MPDPENPIGPDNSGTSVIDADGNFKEDWANDYDEGDRPTLSRFTRFDEMVKSHMNLRRKFNKDPDTLVELPNEHTSDEDRAEFHRKRGVPDDVKGYKYVRSEDLSDNVAIDDEKLAAYYELSKKANLTKEQFNIMANGHLALVDKDIAAFDLIQEEENHKANAEAESALRKKLGKAYEERVARANAIMRKYGGDEAVAALKLENNPLMVEFIDNIAEDMSEDRIKGITSTTVPTTVALDNRIAELRKHPAYNNSSHPEHKKVQAEVQELYKKKYPD